MDTTGVVSHLRRKSSVHRFTSIGRTSISRIFDKPEEISGTGTFLVILYLISRNLGFDKSDICHRKSELPQTRKVVNARHRAHSR